uniref:GDSL esterase/lipase n=1 Tax=Oryza barthii TaxID=65489 RepID=A0A0D3G9U1_9ORYZ
MAGAWRRWPVVVAAAVVLAVAAPVQAAPQVPCYFVFGDSLVDNGNNNDIVSLARANYPPYGIDFAGGAATGRFSNGLTTVDVISKLLGFEDFIPPFAGASSDQLLTGVNFASAAAGIREETGQQLGARISFSGQVQNYQSAVQQLYTPEQYADDLAARYAQLLRAMYSNGARKVALVGVGQVGCSPNELAQQSANGVTCVERINSAIRIFNQKLVGLVDQFNTLPGAHFTYINIYGIFDDILGAPGSHGLKVTNQGCCGVGRNNGQVTCLPFQTPCANRHEYAFWDAFHPTEAANVLVGQRTYSARLQSDVHPVDLRTLASL